MFRTSRRLPPYAHCERPRRDPAPDRPGPDGGRALHCRAGGGGVRGGRARLPGGRLPPGRGPARRDPALRERTRRPFGVNLFVPGPREAADGAALEAYVARRAPAPASRAGTTTAGEEKLALLREERPPLVSFTFGCPPAEVVRLPRLGWHRVTVTTAAEARSASDAGAGGLVLQGIEAGGHRSTFADAGAAEESSTLALVRLVASGIELPLVAAGGIGDAAAVAAVLDAGASAAQVGTGFMLAPEAGTHPAHRAALRAAGRPRSRARSPAGAPGGSRTASCASTRPRAERLPAHPLRHRAAAGTQRARRATPRASTSGRARRTRWPVKRQRRR